MFYYYGFNSWIVIAKLSSTSSSSFLSPSGTTRLLNAETTTCGPETSNTEWDFIVQEAPPDLKIPKPSRSEVRIYFIGHGTGHFVVGLLVSTATKRCE